MHFSYFTELIAIAITNGYNRINREVKKAVTTTESMTAQTSSYERIIYDSSSGRGFESLLGRNEVKSR